MPGSETVEQSLSGRTIVITADRRKGDLASALERRGAIVMHAPAVSTIPHLDDEQLVADTRALIDNPPNVVIATTGIGFRGWIEAAQRAGVGEQLVETLRGARIVARGPKARGAVQGAGLTVEWVAESEMAAEVRDYVLAGAVNGLRIAVQHHGTGSDGLDEALQAAGATVQPLLIYGSGPPANPELHRRGIAHTAAGKVDAVLFTSPPGAQAWLAGAQEAGLLDHIRSQVSGGRVLLGTVGPVTAAPLIAADLSAQHPERWRMGALVRMVSDHFADLAKSQGSGA